MVFFVFLLNAQITMNSSGFVTFSKGINFGNGECIAYYDLKIKPSSQAFPKFFIHNSTGNIGISLGPNTPNYALDVGSTMRVVSTLYYSDKNVKTDIRDLPSLRVNDLFKLNAKLYKYDLSNKAFLGSSNDETFKRDHFCILAQDIKNIYPELVYEDSLGILSVDYIEMIPILLESIKSLKNEINELQMIVYNNSSFKSTEKPSDSFNNNCYLVQNSPNPFSESTNIEYYLADIVHNASIYIYDMNGTQLKSIPLHQLGYGNTIISGRELKAGMYMYTLIADGQVIDTKRMILTD